MTYYIEPDNNKNGRTVLVRSNIRPSSFSPIDATLLLPESGEKIHYNISTSNISPTKSFTDDTQDTASDNKDSQDSDTETCQVDDVDIEISFNDSKELAQDDALADPKEQYLEDDDERNLHRQLLDTIKNTEEDYKFEKISSHRWDNGLLYFTVELTSGKTFEVSFPQLKKDRPLEVAKYIRKEVVEEKRGGPHELWAKNILKNATRTIR